MRLIIFIMIISIAQISMGHPGATNKDGCHISSDNGRKHCHKAKKKKPKHSHIIRKKKLKKKKS